MIEKAGSAFEMSKYTHREDKKIIFKADSPFSLVHVTDSEEYLTLFCSQSILSSGQNLLNTQG